jgi:prepilin-type N-terminal cleavage/methylation domain-containing protein
MLSNIRQRKEQKGFTIIEVLIVLAIAGLIMLIVFLAVPALQRNSRNTQAKNAASSILGAVSEFQNNNNGAMPTTVAVASDGTLTVSSTAAGTTSSQAKIQGGYTVTASTTFPTATTTGAFTVGFGQKCNGNTGFTAANRSTAVAFYIEPGGTPVSQCVES